MMFVYTPPSDEARRIVWAVLVAHMRKDGLDAEAFRDRYFERSDDE